MSEKKKFLLRLDAALYDALEKWAADELRSINAQMEYVLKEAVRKSGRLDRGQEKPEMKTVVRVLALTAAALLAVFLVLF